jgi:glycolate oxidase FAD binding subunit
MNGTTLTSSAPRARVQPASPDDVAAAVRFFAADAKTVEIVGSGTKLQLGDPVSADGTLDLSKLAGVDFYEPEELVIRVQAGLPIDQLHGLLADRGQQLAFDPPDYAAVLGVAGGGTIGGVVAANLAGPARLSGGAPRDALLGFEGVNGRGEAFKAGGRTVKNVTGFDLPKLIAGSYGTLAVITSVTLKVVPRPASEATLLLSGLDAGRAMELLMDALATAAGVTCAAHLPPPLAAAPTTALRLEGPPKSVADRLATLEALLHRSADVSRLDGEQSAAFWAGVRDLTALSLTDEECLWRLLGPATQAARIVKAVGGRALYDWGGAQVFLATPLASVEADAAALRALLGGVGGRAHLLRAPDAVRLKLGAHHPRPPVLEDLTERTRHAFDPLKILNPGRLGLGSAGAR